MYRTKVRDTVGGIVDLGLDRLSTADLGRLRAFIEEGIVRAEKLRRDKAPTPLPEIYAAGGGVYFLQATGGGPIKIGRAKDVASRLAHVQIGSPRRLRLVGFIETAESCLLERLWHSRWRRHRLEGEWFAAAPALVEAIRSLKRPTSTSGQLRLIA